MPLASWTPLYSAGLDYCSWTVTSAVNRIEAELDGSAVDVPMINKHWLMSYHGWFNALYRDKYYYLGDKELMTAAMLMDLGLFFFGPVRSVVHCLKYGFGHLPFTGPMDSFVCKLMAFYNSRLARIAQKRTPQASTAVRICAVARSLRDSHRLRRCSRWSGVESRSGSVRSCAAPASPPWQRKKFLPLWLLPPYHRKWPIRPIAILSRPLSVTAS